jgi:hypothetical protein
MSQKKDSLLFLSYPVVPTCVDKKTFSLTSCSRRHTPSKGGLSLVRFLEETFGFGPSDDGVANLALHSTM